MKNYPVHYSQNDPQWANIPLGTSKTVTIGSGGCFVTSLASKANYYGITVDPAMLNTLFTNKPIYINGDLLPDNALAQAYQQVIYLKTIDYEPIPTDLGTIANLLSDNATTLTARINLGNGNYHFVEIVNCDGTTLHILNALNGQIEDFTKNYGNPVTAKLHVLVYTGTVPQPVVAQPQQQSVAPSTAIAIAYGNAITKSKNFDTVAQFLGMSNDTAVTTTAGQQVVNMISDLQKQLEEDNTHINELQTKLEKLSTATQIAPTVVSIPSASPNQANPTTPTEVPSNTADLTATVVQPTFSDGKPAVGKQVVPPDANNPIPWIKRQQQANQAAAQAANGGNFLTRIIKLLFL